MLTIALLSLIITARLALGTVYSLLQPPLESHDETGHSAYVAYVAQHLALPKPGGALTPYFDEGHQPPLYYLIPGVVGRLLGATGDYQPPMNPFFLSGDGSRGVNAAVHVPSVEAAPWHGGVLLIHIARFWSVLLGGLMVLLTYIAGRLALPDRPAVALAGAAIAAFVPTSLAVTDAATNDALVPVTFGLALIASLRMLQAPSVMRALTLGAVIGLSLLTKNSALILLPFALPILVIAWRSDRQPSRLIAWGLGVYGAALAIAGWWYLRNRLLFGHWITDRAEGSAIINTPGFQGTAILHSASGSFVGQLLTYSFRSFWVLMGWGTLVAPDSVFNVLLAVTLCAVAGLLWFTVRALRRGPLPTYGPGRPFPTWLGAGVLAAFFVAMIPEPLYRAIYYEAPTLVPGRYLFGAIGAAGLLLALGLSALVPRWPVLLAVPGAALAGLAIWLLPNVIVPAYAAPPPLPLGTAIPNSVDVDFGAMHLIGYRIDQSSAPPGGTLHVVLYWQALRPMTVSYTVGVHVVDINGVLLGGVDGLPGKGNLGTPIWRVGQTYADDYDVPIQKDVAAPQVGRLLIGVEQQVLDPLPKSPTNLRPIPVQATDSTGRVITPLLGRFRIGQAVNAPLRPPEFRLGNDLGVIHASVAPEVTNGSSRLLVHVQLQALRATLPRLVFFAHLLGADGRLLAAAPDAEPLDNRYPTDLWPTGETVENTLAIPEPSGSIPAGSQIEVGAYVRGHPEQRLAVTAADGSLQPGARILLPVPALIGR